MLETFVKYTFFMYASIYTYKHILNIQGNKLFVKYIPARLYTLADFTFSICCFPVTYFMRQSFSMFTIPVMVLLLSFYCYLIYKKNVATNTYIFIISLGITYVIYLLLTFLIIPIVYNVHNALFENTIDNVAICSLIVAICSYCVITLIFSTKRFKNGIPGIENFSYNTISIFIGAAILFVCTLSFCQKKHNMRVQLVLLIFILILGVVFCLWWRQYITNMYVNRTNLRTIEILEQTNNELQAEIEKLSKLIHKDNKLISALELSVKELYKTTNNENCTKLLNELEYLSAQRNMVLSEYENDDVCLLKTNVYPVDIILSYLYKRSCDNDIDFKIAILGNIQYMVSEVIKEHNLVTLLSELGENAILSVTKASKRNILISAGVRNKYYFVDIYDSGYCFDDKVIQNIGQKRYTTRKAEGGSGIGLMNVFEILRKHKASFELETIENNSLYTKRVSVIFDSKSESRIFNQQVKSNNCYADA